MNKVVLLFSYINTHLDEYKVIGPILDDRLKKKILKPWKGALSSHSVCVSVRPSVCPCVNNLQGTPFDLGT